MRLSPSLEAAPPARLCGRTYIDVAHITPGGFSESPRVVGRRRENCTDDRASSRLCGGVMRMVRVRLAATTGEPEWLVLCLPGARRAAATFADVCGFS